MDNFFHFQFMRSFGGMQYILVILRNLGEIAGLQCASIYIVLWSGSYKE